MPSAALASSALGSFVLGYNQVVQVGEQPAVVTYVVIRDNRVLAIPADLRLYVEPEDE